MAEAGSRVPSPRRSDWKNEERKGLATRSLHHTHCSSRPESRTQTLRGKIVKCNLLSSFRKKGQEEEYWADRERRDHVASRLLLNVREVELLPAKVKISIKGGCRGSDQDTGRGRDGHLSLTRFSQLISSLPPPFWETCV
jgi:hypothetical protein